MTQGQQNTDRSQPLPESARIPKRLSGLLIGLLIGLVLLFDLICFYAPQLMGAPIATGSVISYGIVCGLVIVLIILAASLYYVRRMNKVRPEAGEEHGSQQD